MIQVRIDRQRAWVEGLELPITDAMYDEMTAEAWREVERLRARGNRAMTRCLTSLGSGAPVPRHNPIRTLLRFRDRGCPQNRWHCA